MENIDTKQLSDDKAFRITPHSVFYNYRSGKGLRLSKSGCFLMQEIYDSYEIKIKSNKPIKTKDIILLEKHTLNSEIKKYLISLINPIISNENGLN